MSPAHRMIKRARNRARLKGREFSIRLSDITVPELCPVFGTPMDYPSLDRIDSRLGYVPSNIRVISLRANVLKNNATVEEMELILEDLRRIRAAGVCLERAEKAESRQSSAFPEPGK